MFNHSQRTGGTSQPAKVVMVTLDKMHAVSFCMMGANLQSFLIITMWPSPGGTSREDADDSRKCIISQCPGFRGLNVAVQTFSFSLSTNTCHFTALLSAKVIVIVSGPHTLTSTHQM